MAKTRRWPAFGAALVTPALLLATAHHFLLAEIVWLWVYFTVVVTLGALLLTWIFYQWGEDESKADRPRGAVSLHRRS